MFFFSKQKTAYEMRISDWSSDVCSSDLQPGALEQRAEQAAGTAQSGATEAAKTPGQGGQDIGSVLDQLFGQAKDVTQEFDKEAAVNVLTQRGMKIGRASCRESVCK